ncbi:MAG: WYL domain-containing protein [Cyanobacteriota bacterium]|nr:WYL domain-containing protein [Cyanobacteriota bacterium]
MSDKPRYSRVSDMIELAVYMASKVQGITINDIMKYYGVSRRTAERMRDSLICIFSDIEEIETSDGYKHWGFTSNRISSLISFSPKEIANLEQVQRRTTNKELKSELNGTITKIKALTNKNKNSLQDNIELFMQTEGYAIRQMPQYHIDLGVLDVIRTALQHSQIVTAIYHDKQRVLEPLGLIYGEKIYLIAREKAKGKGIYNYLLHKFSDMKLTDKFFNKGNFNLQEYSKQSFGVYHGKILNVKLSFSKELASEAAHFNFHPTQKINFEDDGTLTVNFKASGDKEILWHVFKWGKGCRIISPKSLKKEYVKYLQDCLNQNI